MRKLASIQKIAALEPIIGADVIEKATVLGWQLVVKKGEFQVGDWCVYCEIDSVLPDYPVFEWVRAGCDLGANRVKSFTRRRVLRKAQHRSFTQIINLLNHEESRKSLHGDNHAILF